MRRLVLKKPLLKKFFYFLVYCERFTCTFLESMLWIKKKIFLGFPFNFFQHYWEFYTRVCIMLVGSLCYSHFSESFFISKWVEKIIYIHSNEIHSLSYLRNFHSLVIYHNIVEIFNQFKCRNLNWTTQTFFTKRTCTTAFEFSWLIFYSW